MHTVLVLVLISSLTIMPWASVCRAEVNPGDGDYRDLNKNGRMDPYESPDLAVEDRVNDLLSRMTLEEKAGQMIHSTFGSNADGMPPENLEKEVREDMVGFLCIGYSPGPGAAARCMNKIQKWAEDSRLGIPVVVSMDSVHGLSYVTGAAIWPHALGLAATRNMGLVRKLAGVLAKESRAVGVHESLGPVADVGTEPRWGRVMETCGEDADLAAEMVRAQVEVLQGEAISKNSVLCTTKHFPGAGPEKDGVDAINLIGGVQSNLSVIVSNEDTLQYHLKTFKAAIEAGTGAIMPYYSSVEVIEDFPALGSHKVLVELLREDLGYDGIICSDWLPVGRVMLYGYSEDEATRMVVKAGVDVFGGTPPSAIGDIVPLVKDGEIAEEEIDDSVKRILRVKFKLGLFDDPYVDPEYAEKIVGCEEHQRLSLQAARESMTLLKNDGILPLSGKKKTTEAQRHGGRKDLTSPNVLVAGPRSNDIGSLAGGWTGYPQPGLTLLEAIKNKVSEEAQVFHVLDDAARAEELAKDADMAIVAVGEPEYGHTSPWGPGQLSLEDKQLNLIKAIHATGTPTVVILFMGRPYIIPWCAENVSAILVAYYPGTRGGEAIADVLFGDHNPTGKLPFQMPRSMEQVKAQREDLPFDIEDPLYPYGYGISFDND